MKVRKVLLILLVAGILAACSLTADNEPNDEALISTAVTQTQAAAEQPAQDNNQTGEVETEPESAEEADYPAKQICLEFKTLIEAQVGMDVVVGPASFSDVASGVNGDGCQLSFSASGDEISDWGPMMSSISQAVPTLGWEIDWNFSGGGAGGELLTIRRDGYACTYVYGVGPEDSSLCSSDEALVACLERLDPAYILYEISMGCTPDTYVPTEAQEEPEEETVEETGDEAIRISFDAGATSSYVNGELQAADSQLYVLTAMEGQEMVVNLYPHPPLQAILVIYGADGTVLISDHAAAGFWYGTLPLTQDYYISVRASVEYPIAYSMEVIIPPVGETYTGGYSPMVAANCQSLAALLSSATGIEATVGLGLFTDHIAGTAGTGCQITSWGTFDMFTDRGSISTALDAALTGSGWVRADEYGAGGAGGFMTGYTNGESLCLYTEVTHQMDPWVCDDYSGAIYECWQDQPDTGMYYEIEIICATPN